MLMDDSLVDLKDVKNPLSMMVKAGENMNCLINHYLLFQSHLVQHQ
jgi:hypothetical protein